MVHITYTIVKFSSKDVLECSLGTILKSLDTLSINAGGLFWSDTSESEVSDQADQMVSSKNLSIL